MNEEGKEKKKERKGKDKKREEGKKQGERARRGGKSNVPILL